MSDTIWNSNELQSSKVSLLQAIKPSFVLLHIIHSVDIGQVVFCFVFLTPSNKSEKSLFVFSSSFGVSGSTCVPSSILILFKHNCCTSIVGTCKSFRSIKQSEFQQ